MKKSCYVSEIVDKSSVKIAEFYENLNITKILEK